MFSIKDVSIVYLPLAKGMYSVPSWTFDVVLFTYKFTTEGILACLKCEGRRPWDPFVGGPRQPGSLFFNEGACKEAYGEVGRATHDRAWVMIPYLSLGFPSLSICERYRHVIYRRETAIAEVISSRPCIRRLSSPAAPLIRRAG